MIDLYAYGSPNVVKVIIALEEMQLPYSIRPVELLQGASYQPEFLKLNPLGKVPVIVDQDAPSGRPFPVFESGAILIYLAEKAGMFLPSDIIGRSETIQWLMMQVANVGPAFGQCVHFSRYAPTDETAYARSRFRTNVRNLLEVIDGRLHQEPYMAGKQYSIADMALFPWILAVGYVLGEPAAADYQNIARWSEELNGRSAVVKAQQIVTELRQQSTLPSDASPDLLDRFFGRGAYAKA